MREWIRSHRIARIVIPVVAVAAVAAGVYWFAPQRLVLDREVAEALPTPSPSAETAAAGTDDGTAEQPATQPVELASGTFRSLEHETTGTARVVELEDGSRFVRLEDLDTSDGPDLRIYLTDQPVSDDWHVWDDGRYVDLGALKGNVGDSNYRVPDDVALDAFRTVVIWCRRFTVGFAVAPL
jgi:Electron transfer DM13